MQQSPNVSPDLFWQMVTGYQATEILKAAIELDVFTAIDAGAATSGQIAAATGSAERGSRILCDALTVYGFLEKHSGSYFLTPSSKVFLSRNSEAYIGSVTQFIAGPEVRRGFDTFADAVRNGGTVVNEAGSVDPESPMWVTFARAMMPMMILPARAIADLLGVDTARPLKVLDIAAGHGIFGITIAQKYPNAEVTGLDWKNVLEVAREHAVQFGVDDRYRTLAGSAFDVDFGSGYDVVLLTNFLHHFDAHTCISLIRKCHAALADGGRVVTLEFVPNDDRISPPREALFAPVMLAGTPTGDAYTFNDLKAMFEAAGFAHNEHVPIPPTPQHLVVSTK